MNSVSRRAFTLVEVLIVVVILAIIAAIVVPQFSSAATEADHVAASQLVGIVQRKIGEYHALKGKWPTAIDDAWFSPPGLPTNPYSDGAASLTVQNIAGKTELDIKHSKGGPIIYWYNQANGCFHTRVPWQGTNQETLDLYNRVNHSAAKNF
ncbi:MAG TPA: prepilin-type N-terminal cleavage/methylation domain-containing protein [Phycisphaerae bacterium]|nr:prepilin-type N-terminal cleavage/methylation domain-containing protein [Phycisphaerales bacterium]HRX87763.1 prepilin-type N-terminal cleavage/methylation domain-containing protein [Phycisphaerae bacterium]